MSTADSQLLLGSAIATDALPLMKRLARRMEHLQILGRLAEFGWVGFCCWLSVEQRVCQPWWLQTQ